MGEPQLGLGPLVACGHMYSSSPADTAKVWCTCASGIRTKRTRLMAYAATIPTLQYVQAEFAMHGGDFV
jgi:hypothetical protein